MSTNTHILRCAVFFTFASCSTFAMALGGTVRFYGAIAEPVCTVQTQTIDLTALSAAKTASQIPLNVYCNANQSVQISLTDAGGSTGGKSYSAGASGAEVAISHKARLLGPGDKISYAFNGKQEMIVPLTATLKKAADIAPGQLHGSVLVSFEYR